MHIKFVRHNLIPLFGVLTRGKSLARDVHVPQGCCVYCPPDHARVDVTIITLRSHSSVEQNVPKMRSTSVHKDVSIDGIIHEAE
jgi:hypothetical protein